MTQSFEQALLARARPQLLQARVRLALNDEIPKGCQGHIAPFPVALEPVYRPVGNPADADVAPPWVAAPVRNPADLVRLQVWVPPEQDCNWRRSELFLKQVAGIGQPIGFEICGNQRQIVMQFLVSRAGEPVLRAAFAGQFERSQLVESLQGSPLQELPLAAWDTAAFLDYYPPPPYSHSLTNPDELQRSPYTSLLTGLSQIPPPAVGVYQVLFARVAPDHDWHLNVQALLDYEYSIKTLVGLTTPFRSPQQSPSGDLRHMADATQAKAHNDKPLFAAALRIGVIQEQGPAERVLQTLAVITHLFQHGGRSLNAVTADQYRRCLSGEQIRSIFLDGLAYRPGFLINSWELTSLVHMAPPALIEPLNVPITVLESLAPDASLSEGTPLGTCLYAGREQLVCLPEQMRDQHIHAIGRSRTGKSSLLESMILDDIARGHGVAVLDPHGPLLDRLLCLMPREHVDRVIYFDPGNLDWVPIWNPLRGGLQEDPGRMADDFVSSIKSVVRDWGDRLEHLLRHAVFGLLHVPHTSLLDVSTLLRHKSPESEQLRSMVIRAVESETAKAFWRYDFAKYRYADLAPAQHKLSKLLTARTVSLMLSQTDTAFDFRDIMDTGKILLVNLSTIGDEVRQVLGSFILSLLHQSALSRSGTPTSSHRLFHVYCDEAHRFLTDAVEDLIAETLKFKVSLTLAHQYMKQLDMKKAGAVSGVDTTIIFRVDSDDAHQLAKSLQQSVAPEELMALQNHQAIARIGDRIVRFRTNRPPEIPEHHYRQEIIDESRARYCRPVEEVRRQVRDRQLRWQEPLTGRLQPISSIPGRTRRPFKAASPEPLTVTGDFSYDEL